YFDRCLEFAAEVGALAMTYHQGGGSWGFLRAEEEAWQHNLDYAMHLSERARELGMPVGYEAGSLNSLKYVCDRVEGWGINLDIGHAYMSARTDEGFMKYIDELGDRIVEIHHNGVNQYWGGFMEHQPPHLNNTIDFQNTYTRLKEIGYAGPIVCEIQGQDIAQVIRHCQESKDMIVGIWNGEITLTQRWNITEPNTE
ncbi:sugar phosphate isomerase/epimerase family protein, partial [Candidatus Hydrogenedentota bacterium]